MSDSDSDDDLGAFAFMKKKIIVEDNSEREKAEEAELLSTPTQLMHPNAIDMHFMSRDVDALKELVGKSQLNDEALSHQIAIDILEGRHVNVVQNLAPESLRLNNLVKLLQDSDTKDTSTNIRNLVYKYISDSSSLGESEARMNVVLMLGTALLELYCQENYTGPELLPATLKLLHGVNDNEQDGDDDGDIYEKKLHERSLTLLECDGVYAFNLCKIPHTILLSRYFLSSVSLPNRCFWQSGIKLDKVTGKLMSIEYNRTNSNTSSDGDGIKLPYIHRANQLSKCCTWLSVRAAMIHSRMMHNISKDILPTMYLEIHDCYNITSESYKLDYYTDLATTTNVTITNENENENEDETIYKLITQIYLEKGLYHHHYEYKDKGKYEFNQAKLVAGLQTVITGSYGKRTKYQQKSYAQMLLLVKSSFLLGRKYVLENPLIDPSIGVISDESNIIKGGGLAGLDLENVDASGMPISVRKVDVNEEKNEIERQKLEAKSALASATATATATTAGLPGIREGEENDETESETKIEPQSEGWQHGEYEVGRRLVSEAADGEEASIREVLLDSCDGGAQENILIEGGPKYENESIQLGIGLNLHPIDQAIVLGLCLDVTNSNADEGLTREEKFPYLERCLKEAKSWMIHSTGLLERSWLEFEKNRTADRAMLQIQALLDQHTTKLTVMQSTFKSITEDSAPIQDRLSYLHCIVYPSQYELKKDLARKYLRGQIIASALNYFRELEMWDEVVDCYQLMSKPHRAELIVRERIKMGFKTPYMVCSLADLTNNLDLYEEAWVLSNYRFGRAKRTLGKICFDNNNYEDAIKHFDAALTISPMHAISWYMKGLSCMRIQLWQPALEAFSICVQQDMEIGEAWANSGSIYSHLNEHSKALMAFEQAYKYKRDSWRLIENLMITTLLLNKFMDCIMYMGICIDLKEKSDRPVHKDELRRLCFMTTAINRKKVRENRKLLLSANDNSNSNSSSNNNNDGGSGSGNGNATNNTTTTVYNTTNYNNFEIDMKLILEEDNQQELIFINDNEIDKTCKSVERLLERITSTVIKASSDPEIWDIFADFEISLGRLDFVLNCRTKQFRSLLNITNWEKDEEMIMKITRSAGSLYAIHSTTIATISDVYSCSSLLKTAQRKVMLLYEDSTYYETITNYVENMSKKYETMKAGQ